MGQLGGAEAEQPVAVAQQAVEHPFLAVFEAGLDQHRQEDFRHHRFGEGTAHAVQQVAEGGFAVGVAYRAVEAFRRLEAGQLSVVGEAPVAPPELTHEGVGVGQADLADVGLANMADHRLALDRIALHQARHFGFDAGRGVLEQAQAAAFIEADAPAIAVRAGAAAALHQAGEAEDDIGGDVGAHAKQFTHGSEFQLQGDFQLFGFAFHGPAACQR
ncbi:hypothetical protein D9M71_401490 [compost metagenome]